MSDVGGPGGPPDGDVDGDHPTELRQYKSVRYISCPIKQSKTPLLEHSPKNWFNLSTDRIS